MTFVETKRAPKRSPIFYYQRENFFFFDIFVFFPSYPQSSAPLKQLPSLQPKSSRPLLLLFFLQLMTERKNTCMTFRNFCHPSMTNDTFSDTFFHSHFFHDEWREAIKCNATPRRRRGQGFFVINRKSIYFFCHFCTTPSHGITI